MSIPAPSAACPSAVTRPSAPPMWLLLMISFSGTLAMHMVVPILPEAARALQASPGAVQRTISTYIVGLAIGQLIYGPIADRFGRRPTLLVSLSLFIVGSVLCAFAGSVEMLVAARFLQALGGCAGVLIPRAIIRDTSHADEAMRRQASMTLMMMIGPGLSPLIGSLIVTAAGWRAVFDVLVAIGAAALIFTYRTLPETGAPGGKLNPASVVGSYARLLGSRRFVGFALGGGCATTSFYAYIAAAPFIIGQQMHRPLHEVGIYLGLMIVGMSIGNILAGRTVSRFGMAAIMRVGSGASAGSALALLATALLDVRSAPWVGALMVIYTLGTGMCSPASVTKSLSVDPRLTGSAAGLYGSTQMLVGAICTSLVGLGSDPLLAAALILVACSVIAQLAFRDALRQERLARADTPVVVNVD